MIKFKTFSFGEPDAEEKINKFIEEHYELVALGGKNLFSDRICFLYDDDQEHFEKVLALKEEIKKVERNKEEAEKILFFTKRGIESGRITDEQKLIQARDSVANLEAEISYLNERLTLVQSRSEDIK